MTEPRHTPDDELIQHFRQHSTGEPPASLCACRVAPEHVSRNSYKHRVTR